MRSWFRVLPAALVGPLIALAILAPSPRAAMRPGAVPSAMVYPRCDYLLQQGGSTGTFTVALNAGVIQPINFVGNVAACSLTVESLWSHGRLEMVQWDPLTLAPDPTTVALRTRAFDPSQLMYNGVRADFYPPIVTRTIAKVADPPRQTTAIDWRATGSFYAHTMHVESDGPPDVPAALQYPAGGGARTPLPGTHPVLSHAVCGGDDVLQGLYVIQSVMTTNRLLDVTWYDLIQRFRVPVRSRLHWVEVAFGVNPNQVYYDPLIAIVDAEGASTPPTSLPPSLVEAPYAYFVTSPFWGSHYDFDHLITLEPGHDYWLLVRVEHQYLLYSRTLTGGESADFAANIGPFFRRTTLDGSWEAVPGQALSFRLIGEPLEPGARIGFKTPERWPGVRDPGGVERGGTSLETSSAVGVTRSTPGSGTLRLRVAPNPSRGAALVSWSGATGSMRVDVLDAQGRRVAGVSGIAGPEGRWLWRGVHDDGRPLPGGVYFVRATDGGGRVVVDRVALVQ